VRACELAALKKESENQMSDGTVYRGVSAKAFTDVAYNPVGTVANVQIAAKLPQVQEWVNRVGQLSEGVFKSLADLESRLGSSVLSGAVPMPMTASMVADKEMQQMPGLVERLRGICNTLTETESLLRAIHQRLEV